MKAEFDPHGIYAAVNAAAASRRAAARAKDHRSQEFDETGGPRRGKKDEVTARQTPVASGGSEMFPDRPQRPDENIYDWAMATGRLHPDDLRKTKARNLPEAVIRSFWTGSREAADTVAEIKKSGLVRLAAEAAPSRTIAETKAGAFAINPLVDEARASRPKAYEAAMSEGPRPTLFVSGDLPVYMVSGADPSLLTKLPWQARHAAARATAAELAAMFESYGGPDGPLFAESEQGGDAENQAYAQRVRAWLDGPPVDWTVERSPARQLADAETYDLLFGEADRRKAQEAALAAKEREAQRRHEAESLALAKERANLR